MQNHNSAKVEAYLHAQLDPSLKQQTEDEGIHFFGLRFGDIGILLDDAISKELVPLENLRAIPNAPDWLLGFTNIRSTIMPVVALQNLIDPTLPPALTTDIRYLLAVGAGSRSIALPANEFPRKLKFTDTQNDHDTDLAPERLRDFIVGSYFDGTPWFRIRLHEFLSTYVHAG